MFPFAFIVFPARPRVPEVLTAANGLQGVALDLLVIVFGVSIDGLLSCSQEEEQKYM